MTPLLRFGKKPAREGSIRLRFARYFDSTQLPEVPQGKIGTPWLVRQWLMLANDKVGDCVLAGAAHETMLMCAEAGTVSPTFTDQTVVADYSAVTGYDPADPQTDQGTDMQVAAAYRQKVGLGDASGIRHKVDVYAAVQPGNLAQLDLALHLFGVVGLGLQLTQPAMDEFDSGDAWTKHKDLSYIGGHYVPCVGRNSAGNYLVVTWGRLHAATPAWLLAYVDEAVAYMSRERLNAKGLSPQGYDAAALDRDFKQVTGKV